MLDDYVQHLADKGIEDRYDSLSEREREVFQLVAEGYSSKEIGGAARHQPGHGRDASRPHHGEARRAQHGGAGAPRRAARDYSLKGWRTGTSRGCSKRVADLLEIQGANPFRIRAYRTASITISEMGTALASLVENDDGKALQGLPGIGRDLAEKIVTIVRTGELPLIAELSRDTPESLITLMQVPGLGPKRAKLIHQSLGVETIDQLEAAARAGRLARVRGLGPSSEQAILRGIELSRAKQVRLRLVEAEVSVRPIAEALRKVPGVQQLEIAGSYRRRLETVGDVDILAVTDDAEPVVEAFTQHPGVMTVQARGHTRSSVVLRRGLQVDLRVVPATSFGAALQYFTGSQAHGVAVRTLALKRGLKLNEYGVFRGDEAIAGRDEREVYAALGLPWIPSGAA